MYDDDDDDGAVITQADEFTYWNFFLDWGPLSLGNVYRFCRTLQHKMRSDHLQGKVISNEKTFP